MNAYVIAVLDLEQQPPTVANVLVVIVERGWTMPSGYAILAHLQGVDIPQLCRGIAGVLAGEELAWTYGYESVQNHLRDWLNVPTVIDSNTVEHS